MMAENKTEPKGGIAGSVNMKLIIIVGVVVVILAFAVSFGTFMMFSSKNQEGSSTQAVNPDAKAAIETVYDLGEFTSNIRAQSGLRFVKVNITLELSDAKLTEEVENKKPKIQDTVLTILRAKSFEELQETNATLVLKKQIKDSCNRYLNEGTIDNVFFTYFVTQ